MARKRRFLIDTPPGGIMTKEVGAVTGPLRLEAEGNGDGQLHIRVAYEGALEWYEVEGSPVPSKRGLLRKILNHLQQDPGDLDMDGNPDTVDLRIFS